MGHLLDILAADAAGQHAQADAAFQALRTAQAAHPRFAATSCSQRGTDTGPGNSGFSHCADHRARDAERAVLNTAGQALDASRRAAFEAMTNNTQASVIRVDCFDDDQFTSTQPLGDASVRVVYSCDGKDLSIDGAQVGDQFLHIDFFTAQVHGDWYRAIRAEERLASASDKAAAAASWRDA